MEQIKFDYKYHPRILELRVIAYYNVLARQYGVNGAIGFYKAFCELMMVDWQKINGIIQQATKIRFLEKKNRKRYRQEIIFMGWLHDESRYFLANNLLGLTVTTLYKKKSGYKVDEFATEAWLDELDNSVAVCGLPQYALEAKRFLDSFKGFLETIGNVSTPKITI